MPPFATNMKTSKELTPLETGSKDLGAVMSEEATKRGLITKYISKHMKSGVDYGTIKIGGRDSKPSLFKPGSEKFLSLFRLTATFRQDIETYTMQGGEVGVFCYICELKDSSGRVVGEGRGAASMREKSWSLNNCIKIAEKRAQIDAVLRTGALSDFFTQDLEDMAQSYDTSPVSENAIPTVTYDEESPTMKKVKTNVLKKEIQFLVNEIAVVKPKTKEQYEGWVEKELGMDLTDQSEENLKMIITNLKGMYGKEN